MAMSVEKNLHVTECYRNSIPSLLYIAMSKS